MMNHHWLLLLPLLFSSQISRGSAFLTSTRELHHAVRTAALPTPEESAQALTDFMAKAHEEKIRALADLDKKYKQQVEDLQAKLAEHETTTTSSTAVSSNGNSFEFPATNKELTKKVAAYRDFIADYIVKAQIAKVSAVAAAEKKLRDHYEELLSASKVASEVE